MIKHLCDFFCNERQRPTKNVKKIWKEIRVLLKIELLNIDLVFLNYKEITINLMTAALLL
jgi:hypothetical protein